MRCEIRCSRSSGMSVQLRRNTQFTIDRLDQSLSSKILSMVLLMAAEIERELISQRTKEALARRKAEGKSLGRPKGKPGKSTLGYKTPMDYEKNLNKVSGIS